jgi:hypothetical protein
MIFHDMDLLIQDKYQRKSFHMNDCYYRLMDHLRFWDRNYFLDGRIESILNDRVRKIAIIKNIKQLMIDLVLWVLN